MGERGVGEFGSRVGTAGSPTCVSEPSTLAGRPGWCRRLGDAPLAPKSRGWGGARAGVGTLVAERRGWQVGVGSGRGDFGSWGGIGAGVRGGSREGGEGDGVGRYREPGWDRGGPFGVGVGSWVNRRRGWGGSRSGVGVGPGREIGSWGGEWGGVAPGVELRRPGAPAVPVLVRLSGLDSPRPCTAPSTPAGRSPATARPPTCPACR